MSMTNPENQTNYQARLYEQGRLLRSVMDRKFKNLENKVDNNNRILGMMGNNNKQRDVTMMTLCEHLDNVAAMVADMGKKEKYVTNFHIGDQHVPNPRYSGIPWRGLSRGIPPEDPSDTSYYPAWMPSESSSSTSSSDSDSTGHISFTSVTCPDCGERHRQPRVPPPSANSPGVPPLGANSPGVPPFGATTSSAAPEALSSMNPEASTSAAPGVVSSIEPQAPGVASWKKAEELNVALAVNYHAIGRINLSVVGFTKKTVDLVMARFDRQGMEHFRLATLPFDLKAAGWKPESCAIDPFDIREFGRKWGEEADHCLVEILPRILKNIVYAKRNGLLFLVRDDVYVYDEYDHFGNKKEEEEEKEEEEKKEEKDDDSPEYALSFSSSKDEDKDDLSEKMCISVMDSPTSPASSIKATPSAKKKLKVSNTPPSSEESKDSKKSFLDRLRPRKRST